MIGGGMTRADLSLNLRVWAAGQADPEAAAVRWAVLNLDYVAARLGQGYGDRARLWVALHADRYAAAAGAARSDADLSALADLIGADLGAADTAARRALLAVPA